MIGMNVSSDAYDVGVRRFFILYIAPVGLASFVVIKNDGIS